MFEYLINMYNEASYFIIILLLSFIVTLISTLAYKYVTDQSLIKRLKEDIKKLREKSKKHANDQEKMMELQRQMMSKNTQVMKQSFRPMLYTFLPLIIVFAWMAGNLVYEPILPGDEFDVTALLSSDYTGDLANIALSSEMQVLGSEVQADNNKVVWTLRAPDEEGRYSFNIVGEGFNRSKEVLVTTTKDYLSPVSTYESALRSITVEHDTVRPFGDFSLFGWRPGWLGAYILLSIVFSIALRKFFKVA